MVLSAAVSALLSRHGAGDDVVLGTPFAMRSFAGGEDVDRRTDQHAGAAVPVDADAGFGAHIDAVARVCREGYAHGDHPFERLVSSLAVPRSTARHPVFQVAVSWQEAPPTRSPFGAAWLSPVEIDWGLLHFDASFLWSRSSAGIELVLEYAADLFGKEFGARVADRLEVLLGAPLRSCTRISATPSAAIFRGPASNGNGARCGGRCPGRGRKYMGSRFCPAGSSHDMD